MARLADAIADLLARIPQSVIALLGRVSLGYMFWVQGRAQMGGSWNVLEPHATTMALLRGGYDVPGVPIFLAAVLLQLAQFILPVLLVFGLATRFAALGLLVLIAVFEIFVHLGPYAVHGAWAALLLMIIKYGPGEISLDHVLGRR